MFGHLYRVAQSVVREHLKTTQRSPHWRAVRDVHIVSHPACAACGSTTRVQVHHIKPFHLYPELELDPSNLISLCLGPFECHFRMGHARNYDYFVPEVVKYSNVILNHPEQREMYERAALKERLLVDPMA